MSACYAWSTIRDRSVRMGPDRLESDGASKTEVVDVDGTGKVQQYEHRLEHCDVLGADGGLGRRRHLDHLAAIGEPDPDGRGRPSFAPCVQQSAPKQEAGAERGEVASEVADRCCGPETDFDRFVD